MGRLVYPALQAHAYDPTVLLHTALMLQLSKLVEPAHRYNFVTRVRVALSSGTGNRDLWDNPFQLEFSLVDHLSMSRRTRSQKVNTNGGRDSTERVFKLLLSVVNQIFCP